MSLNLNRHGASMQEAWKKVCNEKSDTNWVLFGYEGTSFDLKLISTGKQMFLNSFSFWNKHIMDLFSNNLLFLSFTVLC